MSVTLSRKMIVVWDLDGTILDIKDRYYAIYKKFLEEHGKKPIPIDEYWKLKREKIKLEELFSKSNCKNLTEKYRNSLSFKRQEWGYLQIDKLHEGALEILKAISKIYSQYLLTMRTNRESLIRQLSYLKIGNYFKKIICADKDFQVTQYKKKVDLLKKSRLDKLNGITIGDSMVEAEVAKELNWISVIVTKGTRNENLVKESKPDYILNSLKELHKVKELELVWSVKHDNSIS